MAKLNLTKTELKRQRDLLSRFRRFLPTLELKKEQLIQEIQRVEAAVKARHADEHRVRNYVASWMQLFSEPVDLEHTIKLAHVETREGNIAGVIIPVFVRADFRVIDYDLFATPLWIDRGIDVVKQLAALRAECAVLTKQKKLLGRELRITIQRINLFEKVKIPESRENIRKIQIYLGDQDANAVARGKIAKNKLSDVQIGTFV